jgi:CxxC motif-containing protein (DUF1111 family)
MGTNLLGIARRRRFAAIGTLVTVLLGSATARAGDWVSFSDATSLRMPTGPGLNDPAISTTDPDDKNYAWADIDQDGDIDLVCVRKLPHIAGRRRNVLFMNEGIAEGHAVNGVLIDRTAQFASSATDGGQGLLDLTDDRDVVLIDVNGNGWLDIVTTTTYGQGLAKTLSHPRVFMNQGEIAGVWQGFIYEEPRTPIMPMDPNFCGIGHGDVTGDGLPDLYHVDYNNALEDRLWINDGTGFFVDDSTTRMTAEMLESQFGVHAVIADMNGDGARDIVKDRANGAPYRISISYNDPTDLGTFNEFDTVYSGSPYYVDVTDLNNDTRLDIVLQDDGIDRYLLNQGNGPDGLADFLNLAFPLSSNGIDGTIEFGDLNNDGFVDVLITDGSVNTVGTPCARFMDIYQNRGNTPNVTFIDVTATIPASARNGTSDVAVFDIDQDGWLDLVIGTCTGTFVYMNDTTGMCNTDVDCDSDGMYCTNDICVDNICQTGPEPCPGQVCDEATDSCVSCVTAADCDTDALFCTTEVCNGGQCQAGPPPCVGQVCDEDSDSCVNCVNVDDCNTDGMFCTNDICVDNACILGPTPCPGQACDEASDSCVNCIDAASCDDGNLCNGIESCAAGSCSAAPGSGVANGTFDGSAFWTSQIPVDGIIEFPSLVRLTGPDADTGGYTWAAQGTIDLDGAPLQFDLRSYISEDLVNGPDNRYDRPVFYIDGTYYGLNHDGTLGAVVDLVNADYGTIANNNQAPGSIHYVVDVAALTGSSGPYEIGFGVMSVDGIFGPGIASYDNIGPGFVPDADPCPGLLCDPLQGCVTCVTDADCDVDGLFCTGDVCQSGSCTVSDPCPGQVCDEAGGACVINSCTIDSDCEDGSICTHDLCRAGLCQTGPAPCGGLMCDEVRGCVQCMEDSNCATDEFCCDNQCGATACGVALQPKSGDPIGGLTAEELQRFNTGRAAFARNFLPEDGLGPIFNREGCGTCHNTPLGGSGTSTVTRFGIIAQSGSFDPLADLGGSLLQEEAIDPACIELVPDLPGETVITATRVTPSIMGFGLVEAIEDAKLELRAVTPPLAMVNGRIHIVQPLEGGPPRIGRFGWKAQVATVMTFSGDAALNEMGITNDLVPTENAPNGDAALLAACDTIPDPEDVPDSDGIRFIDRVTDFQRFTAPPPQTPRRGMTGEALFASIGCTACHTPVMYTPDDPTLEDALRNQVLRPYSDFLLHDVGPLADGVVQGEARGAEIRTPPLWGLRLRDPMLHDASAIAGTFETRVTQAILDHGQPGSEAEPSVVAFSALPQQDRDTVVAFLDSLGRCEFDLTGDNEVDHFDYTEFQTCFTGPGTFYLPDDPCSVADIDGDGDVDDDDREHFMLATEKCCDLNGDDIRDEACLWCPPERGTACIALTTFADLGGSFGECMPDGFANIHDRNLSLTCFSNESSCDAINLDAGGPFGNCAPDGFCNIHDANHALTAFAGTNACSCPSGPMPDMQPAIAGSAEIRLAASANVVRRGERIDIIAWIDNAGADVLSYQVELEVIGGTAGTLELIDVIVESRRDHIFAGRDDAFFAFAVSRGQMLGGVEALDGQPLGNAAGYLATFTYEVCEDASGTFVVNGVIGANATVLVSPGLGEITIDSIAPATIQVREVRHDPDTRGVRPATTRD